MRGRDNRRLGAYAGRPALSLSWPASGSCPQERIVVSVQQSVLEKETVGELWSMSWPEGGSGIALVVCFDLKQIQR